MKRKVAACLMAGMMMGGMVLPVNAAGTKDMKVTYTENSVYEINIPAEVALSTTETQANIKATKMNVAPNETVKVKVNSGITNGAVTLKRADSTDTTTSKVSLTSGGEGIAADAVVASFQRQNTTPDQGTGTLYFSALSKDLAAGSWAGQIVFSIELVTQEPIAP